MKIELKNEKTTIFNLDALVSVEIVDKKRCNHLNYAPFKKSFWGNTKEGFYDDFSYEPFTKERLESGELQNIPFLVENNVVYYYPYVRTLFVGGNGEVKEFRTYSEALKYGNDIANKGMKAQFKTND